MGDFITVFAYYIVRHEKNLQNGILVVLITKKIKSLYLALNYIRKIFQITMVAILVHIVVTF